MGWASSISYHPNGMLNQVSHPNAIVDTHANDLDMMRRPSSVSAAKAAQPSGARAPTSAVTPSTEQGQLSPTTREARGR